MQPIRAQGTPVYSRAVSSWWGTASALNSNLHLIRGFQFPLFLSNQHLFNSCVGQSGGCVCCADGSSGSWDLYDFLLFWLICYSWCMCGKNKYTFALKVYCISLHMLVKLLRVRLWKAAFRYQEIPVIFRQEATWQHFVHQPHMACKQFAYACHTSMLASFDLTPVFTTCTTWDYRSDRLCVLLCGWLQDLRVWKTH